MILIDNVNSVKMEWVMIINTIVQFVKELNIIVIIVVNVLINMQYFKKKTVLKKVVYVLHVNKIIFIWCNNVILVNIYKIGLLVVLLLELVC